MHINNSSTELHQVARRRPAPLAFNSLRRGCRRLPRREENSERIELC